MAATAASRKIESASGDAMNIPLRKAAGVELVQVTPEIAKHWLTFNTSNRAVIARRFEHYVEKFQRGEWNFQGDAIRFAQGKLLDGQHRLLAIVNTELTVPMVIVFGLEPKVQATIDTGRNRTPRDILSIEGLGEWESRALGAALHTLISVEHGLPIYNNQKYDNDEIRNFYLEHRSALEETLNVVRKYPRRHPLMPTSKVITLHYLFAKKDKNAADAFFDRLFGGNDLAKGSPILYLRDRLHADIAGAVSRTSFEHFGFAIKAWNTFHGNRYVKSGSWLFMRQSDGFPEIQ